MNAGHGLTPSAQLAWHIAHSDFDRLPAATVVATKRAILDGLGVMLAASGSSDVLPFVELARAQGSGPASLLGFAERVGLPMAALANGAMAHALDFEDAFDPVPVHPNASSLPAALAIAEARAPIAGREFIAAIATGCDLVCRLALSLRRPMEAGGWYPPPILGGFGATSAVSRLLRLTPAQITDAYSLLLCQNTCPGEIKHSPDSTIRAVREAFPAQAAVLSSLLAQRGVRGFEFPLEGKSGFFSLYAAGKFEPADLLDGLGDRYWIEHLSFKKWPCCRGTHAYIEAAQTLRRTPGFSTRHVARVTIIGSELQRMLCEPTAQKREPRTIIDAKFSLPFTVATALSQPEVTLDSFTPASLRDPQLLEIAGKAVFQPAADDGSHHAASGELSIQMHDGRVLHHVVPSALGDPARPLDDAALRSKFIDCALRAAVPPTRLAAEQLADRIMTLEGESDVGAALHAGSAAHGSSIRLF
jgi:2-methylcitrate dehydratase PrpD